MSLLESIATEICKTLFDHGYTAYFAGGWVRDLLLGQQTDEIDIATNAPPDKIQRLFPKTIPVGIAFGVVIVVQEGIGFEVTTFRKDKKYNDGRHPEGIDFSTPEKDAQRRDFTINGMFYDPLAKVIYDYVDGQTDLKNGIIRAIGNAKERFLEDRLRMIRAVRFAARFKFKIEQETAEAIMTCASALFPAVSIERIWQEFKKMAAYPHFEQAFLMLHCFGLLSIIFPKLSNLSRAEIEKKTQFFPYFPIGTPLIVYLLELFPGCSLKEKLELCIYLKTPAFDRKLIEFFSLSEKLFANPETTLFEWAYFYAHPFSKLFIQICAIKLDQSSHASFCEKHTQRQKILENHIERIKDNKPLVTAAHLKKIGILPGKKMGFFLKLAEQIAINENIQSSEKALQRLQDEISKQ